MANDEQLRLVAEVVDRFSGPLSNLRNQLNNVKSSPHMAAMKRDFTDIETGVGKAANQIRNSLGPALSALGVTSLGATIGIAGIGTAVAGMVTGAADIRRFAGEVGLSAEKLRELNALGQRFGIDPSQMQSGLRQLQGAAEDFRKHGQLYTDTMARFPETLGKPLASSKTMGEFVDNALQGLLRIENKAVQAEIGTKLFGFNPVAGLKRWTSS